MFPSGFGFGRLPRQAQDRRDEKPKQTGRFFTCSVCVFPAGFAPQLYAPIGLDSLATYGDSGLELNGVTVYDSIRRPIIQANPKWVQITPSLRHFWTKTIEIYQDRLGTNIGKVEGKGVFCRAIGR